MNLLLGLTERNLRRKGTFCQPIIISVNNENKIALRNGQRREESLEKS